MTFSQRIGKKPIRETLQIEAIDDNLWMDIWNWIQTQCFTQEQHPTDLSTNDLIDYIATNYFKWRSKTVVSSHLELMRSDDDATHYQDYVNLFYKKLLEAEWFEKYDFLELIVKLVLDGERKHNPNGRFVKTVNMILQKHMSAYRFVLGELTPITNEIEILEIEQAGAIQQGTVKGHLANALAFLSDKQSPDYPNSIKESISAVESLCTILVSGDQKQATLGKLLKKMGDHSIIHPSLQNAFSSLYGYTTDAKGIRHAGNLDSPDATFEEAKFMLVACSAFCNYALAATIEVV